MLPKRLEKSHVVTLALRPVLTKQAVAYIEIKCTNPIVLSCTCTTGIKTWYSVMELQVLKSNKYIFLLQIEMKSNGLSCTTDGIIFGYGVAGYRYYTPGPSGFWDQSQANSPLYSAFWSVEQTDFKNVIVENIHWALNPMGGLRGCWGLEVVFVVTKAKISKSSSVYHFS